MVDTYVCSFLIALTIALDPTEPTKDLQLTADWVVTRWRVAVFLMGFCGLCGHLCFILGVLAILTACGVKLNWLSDARCDHVTDYDRLAKVT